MTATLASPRRDQVAAEALAVLDDRMSAEVRDTIRHALTVQSEDNVRDSLSLLLADPDADVVWPVAAALLAAAPAGMREPTWARLCGLYADWIATLTRDDTARQHAASAALDAAVTAAARLGRDRRQPDEHVAWHRAMSCLSRLRTEAALPRVEAEGLMAAVMAARWRSDGWGRKARLALAALAEQEPDLEAVEGPVKGWADYTTVARALCPLVPHDQRWRAALEILADNTAVRRRLDDGDRSSRRWAERENVAAHITAALDTLAGAR